MTDSRGRLMAGSLPEQAISVYIYEPHRVLRRTLAQRLTEVPGIDMVGYEGSPERAARQITVLRPAVVVVGLHSDDCRLPIPIQSIIDGPSAPLVIMLDTTYDAARKEWAAKIPGGLYLLKGLPAEDLIAHIRSAESF